MSRKRTYTPEQIINKLREAGIYLGPVYPNPVGWTNIRTGTYFGFRSDGDVTLFFAPDINVVKQEERIQKSNKIFVGRFDILMVPGDHLSITKNPYASQLAKKILDNLPKKEIDSAP